MAISPEAFPPRKRRPSAGAFISPKLSDQSLLRSLLQLCQEISSLEPIRFLLRRTSLSMIRKFKLLTLMFEDLSRNSVTVTVTVTVFSPSALLCFQEMYILLQRIQALIEDSSQGSKMWLLLQNESLANSFHELTLDLSTLLDILPIKDLCLTDDVQELVVLLRSQCSRTAEAFVDPTDDGLRLEVCSMLDSLRKEIVPDHSKLSQILSTLGISDSSSCREELESLQEEFQNQPDEKSKSQLLALVGLVRYAKCVLFGASTPTSDLTRRKSSSELSYPVDFRCPISLELMREPVAVATGQTYDRESIKLWIESGHNTCPKTGQTLAHTELIPNRALKNLIAMWCREQRIPFETLENKDKVNAVKKNKAALQATRMTASFLVSKLSLLSVAQSMEAATALVYELRTLAKTDSDCRACIAEAGAIPLFVRYLGSDVSRDHPNLQVHAVTTILNLSILEANKTRIMETDGALNGVIEVLRSGATWEAKGNAAATVFSLSGVQAYRKRLGRKPRVIKGLVELANEGPVSSKRDALVAILNLAGERETVARLVEGGVVEMTVEVMEVLPEEAATILEVVVRGGGMVAITAAYGAIRKLGGALREGSDRARESAAATLVTICRKGGSEMVAELASIPGIERVIWELMGVGTVRARRKAASLLRVLRRWAAGLDSSVAMEGYSTIVNLSTTTTAVVG